MENQLVWNQRYDIGVDIIDKEHKKLFRILNRLFNFGQQEIKSRWVCRETVKYFKDHALLHFLDEEEYMESIDYAGYEMHKRIHKNFRDTTLPALERELERTDYSEDTVDHFFGVCAGWLIGHTLIEDQAIVNGKVLKHWENLLPEEEQSAMEQTIASHLQSMFQLKPKMISNCYGGEKFGDGIYYRLIYKNKENKVLEFLMVFEEQLIVSTIGSVIETKAKEVNVMLMNAAIYTARQLVGHIKDHFPSLESYDVQEEQLLNYDQFQKIFEKNSPQSSLLFDTGKGYFAYCMAATDACSDEGGVSIIMDSTMESIEKYLDQNKAERNAVIEKKKLLMIDDSKFMLQMLQQMFSVDYEVVTSASVLSTFRSITLSRPDLILLYYDMPDQKGKQILEMIHSEKDFRDIPIIFLTSRSDKESIKKMAQMEPQVYLDRSLSPDLIKKEVDLFLQGKIMTNKKE